MSGVATSHWQYGMTSMSEIEQVSACLHDRLRPKSPVLLVARSTTGSVTLCVPWIQSMRLLDLLLGCLGWLQLSSMLRFC